MKPPKGNGFTLFDVTLSLVIMAILVTLAYPHYTNLLFKKRRSDALATLTQARLALEHCYTQNTAYTNCTSLPTFPYPSIQGFYEISLINIEATRYTLAAIPTGSQAGDKTCAQMTIDQANRKTAIDSSGTAQDNCWHH